MQNKSNKSFKIYLGILLMRSIIFLISERIQAGSKVGVGNFVMAVSYTETYDDLQYVANFVNCDHALDYYNLNCTDAKIMVCQQEEYLYMPIGHNSDVPFDFEPTDRQSCGFVGVDNNFTGGTDD